MESPCISPILSRSSLFPHETENASLIPNNEITSALSVSLENRKLIDLNSLDQYYQTPLTIAQELNYHDFAEILEEALK